MCTHLKLISTLISTDPSWSRERTTRGNGIRISPETSYGNEKWNRFACALTNVHVTHLSRSRECKPRSTKVSGYRATVMRSGTDLHVHSPQFNLHAVFPHVCVDPESANLEAQRHCYSSEKQNRFACALT